MTRLVTIKDRDHGLPYSKGVMASSLQVCGILPAQAFALAQQIEDKLMERGENEVQTDDLRDLAAATLAQFSLEAARSYLQWQEVEGLDSPLVILIGGATGVGKSTVATQLAARLGIRRVISTDAIREVMRSAVSEELAPALHVSSFNADILFEGVSGGDPVILGFTEQARAVAVGVKALIARAAEEGTDIIVEGAHIVPGFTQRWETEFPGALILPVVVTVGPEDVHRSHFHLRNEGTGRPGEKYLQSFDKIRRIQAHIIQLAQTSNVETVEAFDLDSTLQKLISTIVKQALARVSYSAGLTKGVQEREPKRSSNWAIMGRRKTN